MTDYKNLIDGEMVDNGEWLEVLSPANEQVVGRVPACGKDELDRAVAAARRAFKEWKKTPQEERQKVVQGIAAAIKGNADELYRLLTSEQGKPHTQAQQEIYGAAGLAAARRAPRMAVHLRPVSVRSPCAGSGAAARAHL